MATLTALASVTQILFPPFVFAPTRSWETQHALVSRAFGEACRMEQCISRNCEGAMGMKYEALPFPSARAAEIILQGTHP